MCFFKNFFSGLVLFCAFNLCTCVAYGEANSPNNSVFCNSGLYYNSVSGICEDCPVGYFCTGGDTDKQKCPPGEIAPQTASTSCTPCGSGMYSDSDHVECVLCNEPNEYFDNDKVCYKCEAGKYIDENNTCVQCPAGYYCNGDGTKKSCANNTYSDAGATECIGCTRGQIPLVDHSACSACDAANEIKRSTICVRCPAGTYKNAYGKDGFICSVCPAGHYCDGDGTKKSCANGTYTAETGRTGCDNCAITNVDHTECMLLSCGAGHCVFDNICYECAAGYACPKEEGMNNQCTGVDGAGYGVMADNNKCEEGSFAQVGQSECTPCPEGYTTAENENGVFTSCNVVSLKLDSWTWPAALKLDTLYIK